MALVTSPHMKQDTHVKPPRLVPTQDSHAHHHSRPTCLQVVMRRGGREDRSRELLIPVSASMAHHLREKEEREAAEKAELKRLVLAAEKRELQEEHAGYPGRGGHHHHQRGRGRGGGGYNHRGGGMRF